MLISQKMMKNIHIKNQNKKMWETHRAVRWPDVAPFGSGDSQGCPLLWGGEYFGGELKLSSSSFVVVGRDRSGGVFFFFFEKWEINLN